jgi:hypothetical protein
MRNHGLGAIIETGFAAFRMAWIIAAFRTWRNDEKPGRRPVFAFS